MAVRGANSIEQYLTDNSGRSGPRARVTGHEQPAVSVDEAASPGVAVALDWAEVAAMLGDFRDAVEWLDYAERLDGVIPAEFAARRQAWLERV